MSWSYRVALNDLNDDLAGWEAFVTLWLPTAVVMGLLVAFGIPAAGRWIDRRRRGR